ncbi:hypothetical protein [Bradyrhizobium sp. BR 1432]|uniref:hypothetical protein n=1 Tax=Bradyrhizobium sp. BR 1432 TaxID=3447966 RepID=UPI003EE7F962
MAAANARGRVPLQRVVWFGFVTPLMRASVLALAKPQAFGERGTVDFDIEEQDLIGQPTARGTVELSKPFCIDVSSSTKR